MEFVTQTFEYFKQLVAALLLLTSAIGAVIFLVSKSKILMKYRIKRRLTTCPQKAVCDLHTAQEAKRIDDICRSIKELRTDLTMTQGAIIAFYCSFAIQRGFFPLYEKVLVQELMDDYKSRGGNHGVDEIFNIAMQLPTEPQTNRRCTDRVAI